MRVASGDREIRRLIERIASTVADNGGYIHPGLVVNHDGPNLWLSLDRLTNPHIGGDKARDKPHPDASALLIVPQRVHVPVTGLDWEQDESALRYTGATDDLTAAQRDILGCMVDLFNACDKVDRVGRQYPQVALEHDPELASQIRAGRPRWVAGDQVTPTSLIVNSRLCREMSGEEGKSVGQFMPMIDMMNHHPYGSRYDRTSDGHRCIKVRHPTDSDQVFVRYNRADSFGVALGLGYFEADTRFVASVPATVELGPIGTVKVIGTPAGARNLPAPRIRRTDEGLDIIGLVLGLEHLGKIRSLLQMPFQVVGPTLDSQRLAALVDQFLLEVVQENIAYFRRLEAFTQPGDGRSESGRIESTPPETEERYRDSLRPLFHQVANHQIRLLDNLLITLANPNNDPIQTR